MSPAEERAAAARRLEELTRRIPKAYADWSWDRTHKFKEAVDKGRRLLTRDKAKAQELKAAVNVLEGFHS